MAGLLPRLSDRLARLSARWVPDSFSIACLLTLLTLVLGLTAGGASLRQCIEAWGGSFWELLGFAMQIVVVIFAGYVVAVSPAVTRLLDALAGLPRSPRQAIASTALLSMALCWLNWGMGLIAAAVLVRIMARRHPETDYRLLVAAAYLGLGTTWHAGPSGSVPLLLATPDNFMVKGGMLAGPVPLSDTIFTARNLLLMAGVAVVFSTFSVLLYPPPERVVTARAASVDALATFAPPPRPSAPTPAERIVHGPILNRSMGAMGLAYIGLLARGGGLSLTLDTVNLVFLSLGMVLHPSPASLLRAAEEASSSLHGVVLQFPLYAGIYGIMKGTALAGAITHGFLSVASARTYPLVVFLYSSVLNYFVPSGGGKCAIEAPYVLGAGAALGVPVARTPMAYAYGDMATNSFRPSGSSRRRAAPRWSSATSSATRSWCGRSTPPSSAPRCWSAEAALYGRGLLLLGAGRVHRAVAQAGPHGDLHRGLRQRAVGAAQGDLHVVGPRLAVLVLLGEAALDLGLARLVLRTVRLVHALAAVVPVPLQLRAVVLLDVVPAGQLGGEQDVDGGEGHARRGAQVQLRFLGLGFVRGGGADRGDDEGGGEQRARRGESHDGSS